MNNEGKTTSLVEGQTRKIPSITFLGVALGAIAVSAGLALAGKKQTANFVGQWVPTILLLGIYNKIAKTFSPPIDAGNTSSRELPTTLASMASTERTGASLGGSR